MEPASPRRDTAEFSPSIRTAVDDGENQLNRGIHDSPPRRLSTLPNEPHAHSARARGGEAESRPTSWQGQDVPWPTQTPRTGRARAPRGTTRFQPMESSDIPSVYGEAGTIPSFYGESWTMPPQVPFIRLAVPPASEMNVEGDDFASDQFESYPSRLPRQQTIFRRPPKKKLTYDDIPMAADEELPSFPRPMNRAPTAEHMGLPENAVSQPNPITLSTILDTLIHLTHPFAKILYTPLLLNIPALYRSRVFKIFLEADLGLAQLQSMVVKVASRGRMNKAMMLQVGLQMGTPTWDNLQSPGAGHRSYAVQSIAGPAGPTASNRRMQTLPPEYEQLQRTWDGFIDSLLEEWKTLGVISALVLSAILTVLQIEDAASDYATRYTALLSLVCSLVSLIYGCIYVIRFGTMRKPHKAAEWALEAQQRTTDPWWNAWIMLAMPAVWQTWSLLFFTTSIMCYIWRTSVMPSEDIAAPSDHVILGLRSVLTAFLVLGIIHGLAIVKTMMRYGSAMDRSWEAKINKLMMDCMNPTTATGNTGADDGPSPGIASKASLRPSSATYGMGGSSLTPGMAQKGSGHPLSPVDSGRGSWTNSFVVPPSSASTRSWVPPSVIRIQPPAHSSAQLDEEITPRGKVQMYSRRDTTEG